MVEPELPAVPDGAEGAGWRSAPILASGGHIVAREVAVVETASPPSLVAPVASAADSSGAVVPADAPQRRGSLDAPAGGRSRVLIPESSYLLTVPAFSRRLLFMSALNIVLFSWAAVITLVRMWPAETAASLTVFYYLYPGFLSANGPSAWLLFVAGLSAWPRWPLPPVWARIVSALAVGSAAVIFPGWWHYTMLHAELRAVWYCVVLTAPYGVVPCVLLCVSALALHVPLIMADGLVPFAVAWLMRAMATAALLVVAHGAAYVSVAPYVRALVAERRRKMADGT